MPRARQQEEADWAPVVGRALAFLCLHYAEMRSKKLLAQEAFLARFGLPRSEAAKVLGTSESSLRELERQESQPKAAPKARGRKRQAKARTARARKR